MAKTPVLTCRTEYGAFSRQTRRKYTHVVVCCGELTGYILEQTRKKALWLQSDITNYRAILKGDMPPYSGCSLADYQRWLANAELHLAGLEKQCHERIEASIRHQEAKTGQAAGWSISLEGARKIARREAKSRAVVFIATVDSYDHIGPVEWVQRPVAQTNQEVTK